MILIMIQILQIYGLYEHGMIMGISWAEYIYIYILINAIKPGDTN